MTQRTNKASNKRAFKLGLKNIREAEDSIEEEDIPVESDETDVSDVDGEDVGETIVELVKSYADKFTNDQKEAISSVVSDTSDSDEDDLDENVIREDEELEDSEEEEDSDSEGDEDLDEDEDDSLTESRARKIREARARVRRNIARRKMMEARKLRMARRAAMNESIRNKRISESRAAKVASLRRRIAARRAALSERV